MTRHSSRRVALLAVACALSLSAGAARAAEQVGTVAALEGTAEAQHPGDAAWTPLAPGAAILLGDELRTPADGKLKLLFRDETVLTLAPNTQLTVDEEVAGPAAKPAAHFTLGAGTARAIVTERYGAPGARFEMETPTAVAGVRGTGFIESYDPTGEETLVVGLFDTTRVRSTIDPRGLHEVLVGPGFGTKVKRGAYPIEPRVWSADVLRALNGMTSVHGRGAPDKELGPRGGAKAEPRLPGSLQRGFSPEGKVVDQPLENIGRRRESAPPPPPPPPPPRK